MGKASESTQYLAIVDTRLMASFPGQPGYTGTRKVKPIWILMKQEMTGWQWNQLNHMQIICTLLQTGNYASISSLNLVSDIAIFVLKRDVKL